MKYSVDPKKDVMICAMYYYWRKKDKLPLKSNGIKNMKLTIFDWSNIYSLYFTCTWESKLHWSQLQLLHRVLWTNYYIWWMLWYPHYALFANKSIFFTYCFVAKEIWIEVERWILEFFNIQTSFNTNSIFFRKYENSSIHRLENQKT